MTQGSNPMSGGAGGDVGDSSLANAYYVHGYNDDGSSYDPNSIFEAIKEKIKEMKLEIANGGHISMGSTMQLMQLMQGFGGEQVGVDGQSASALSSVQNWVSNAWGVANECSTGKFYGGKSPTYSDLSKADQSILDEAYKEGMIPDPKASPTKTYTATDLFTDAIDIARNKLSNAPNIPPKEAKQVDDSLSDILTAVGTGHGDPLLWIYQQAQPGTTSGNKDPKRNGLPTQGDTTELDALTRAMTTGNQQVTGASQVMSTQAKSDSKTQQTEGTAYNNYMQMIKKMLSYFVQLQRTS